MMRRGVTVLRRAARLHGELLDRAAGVTLHPHVCCVGAATGSHDTRRQSHGSCRAVTSGRAGFPARRRISPMVGWCAVVSGAVASGRDATMRRRWRAVLPSGPATVPASAACDVYAVSSRVRVVLRGTSAAVASAAA